MSWRHAYRSRVPRLAAPVVCLLAILGCTADPGDDSTQPERVHQFSFDSESGLYEVLSGHVSQADVDSLELGDAVYLNGTVFTGREGVYSQLFEKKIDPPIDIAHLGGATFHCSPAINETSPGVYNVPSPRLRASAARPLRLALWS